MKQYYNRFSIGLVLMSSAFLLAYSEQETPLMRAALSGDIEAMEHYINQGYSVNDVAFRDQPMGGKPVLRYAIDSGNPHAVEYLLRHGAEPKNFTESPFITQDYTNTRNLSLLSHAINSRAPVEMVRLWRESQK